MSEAVNHDKHQDVCIIKYINLVALLIGSVKTLCGQAHAQAERQAGTGAALFERDGRVPAVAASVKA